MSYLDRTIYDDAVELVDGDRAVAYGDPNVNLENIAMAWNGIIAATTQRNNPNLHSINHVKLTGFEVSLMLAALKIMRAAFKPGRDNFVDANAYIGLAKMVNDKQAKHPASESFKPMTDLEKQALERPRFDGPEPLPKALAQSAVLSVMPALDCRASGGYCTWEDDIQIPGHQRCICHPPRLPA